MTDEGLFAHQKVIILWIDSPAHSLAEVSLVLPFLGLLLDLEELFLVFLCLRRLLTKVCKILLFVSFLLLLLLHLLDHFSIAQLPGRLLLFGDSNFPG